MTHASAALAAILALAGPAAAQEFRGAELSVEALSFDGDSDSERQTTYRGSAEVGFGAFGVAADLSFYDFGDDDLRGLTVHGLYDALEFATVGAFYARESVDGESADTFGVEAGRSFGRLGTEGYVALSQDDVRLFGLDGTLDVTQSASLTAQADLLDGDGASISRLAVGGEYRFAAGPAVYAEFGRLNAQDDDGLVDESETFLGVGARIAIGPNRGTTFGPRGVTEALAGF